MKNRNEEYEDDGRTIVDMSAVERPNLFSFRSPEQAKMPSEPQKNDRPWEDHSMNKEERRWAIFGALKASLLIGLAYVVGLGIAILLLVLYFNKG